MSIFDKLIKGVVDTVLVGEGIAYDIVKAPLRILDEEESITKHTEEALKVVGILDHEEGEG